MKLKVLIRGLLSYIPGFLQLLKKGRGSKGTGGTISARYCYSVWMRHLYYLKQMGMQKIPTNVAEIGPGDSLGIGLMALLCGAKNYLAFDIIEHASSSHNKIVFLELVELLKNKTPVPGNTEFPLLCPKITSEAFPNDFFSDTEITRLTHPQRVRKILDTLEGKECEEFSIRYIVPWDQSKESLLEGKIDLIFSQAVMEHLPQPERAYKVMCNWLRIGGIISHEIDYSAHETHSQWNGHWYYPKWIWKIILHGRSYSINRYSHSMHVNAIANAGFQITVNLGEEDENLPTNKRLPKVAYPFTSQDYQVRNALIQAKKE